MTQTESNIQLTLWGTESIFLPIPPQNPDANTPFELGIGIANGTPTPWLFSETNTLIPELKGPDGQQLPDQQRDHRKPNAHPNPILPGGRAIITRSARLRWQKRTLWLEIFYGTLCGGYGNLHPDHLCWSFAGLKPGTYNLQFAYRSDRHLKPDRPKTPAFALHLIDLPRNELRAIPADGIRFETVVPQPVLTTPDQEAGVTTTVQFGLRVTNLSLTPYRFTFFSLMPELQDEKGQVLRRDYGRNVTKSPQESDFMLLAPQENLIFAFDSKLSWHDGKLYLSGNEGGGGAWGFQNLQPGTYRVRFTYLSNSSKGKIFVMPRLLQEVFDDLWVGMACTPFVEFRLVRS